MPGIAVKSLDFAGGAQLDTGQDFVTAEGMLVIVIGDPVTPHGDEPHDNPHMAQGCDWFTIAGKKVCREGHLADCGHATTGRPWVQVVG